MKPKHSIVIILAFAAIFSSCHKHSLIPVNGKGASVDQSRPINNTDRIQLSIDADLEYVQDSVYSMVLNAQQNILDIIETKNNGSTLIISYNKSPYSYNKVKISIHTPKLYELTVSGSGNINAPSAINAEQLDLNVSGSGNISLYSLTCNNLSSKISGSGKVSIANGQVKNHDVVISGSGNMNLIELQTQTNTSKISGSGNITTWVTESLNVNISGSGSVKYKGQPTVNSQISGSGKLIHID